MKVLNKELFYDLFDLDVKDDIPKPSKIKAYLDKYVVGQSEAKKMVSIALTNHLYKSKYNLTLGASETPLKKSNLMLIGGSGVGKTYIIRKTCDFVDLPFVTVDINEFSGAGYVGKDVTDILKALVKVAGSVKEAETGVIFLDEFDKLAETGTSKRVNKSDVQQGLLKLVEGHSYEISERTYTGGKRSYTIDTTNILIICAGAFDFLIKDTKVKQKIGLSQQSESNKDITVSESDIIKQGFLPELMGRIGTFVQLKKLTEDQLYQILVNIEDSFVKQHKKLIKIQNKKWPLKKKDYLTIIKSAIENNLGARGLEKKLNEMLVDTYYED